MIRSRKIHERGLALWQMLGLMLLGSALVIGVLIGGGMLYVSRHRQGWVAAGQRVKAEAQAVGREHDQLGCVALALDRSDACHSLICQADARIFLSACLSASHPSPGFCSGVPFMSEFTKTVLWRIAQCQAVGRPTQPCQQLMGTIQEWCHQSMRTRANGALGTKNK